MNIQPHFYPVIRPHIYEKYTMFLADEITSGLPQLVHAFVDWIFSSQCIITRMITKCVLSYMLIGEMIIIILSAFKNS